MKEHLLTRRIRQAAGQGRTALIPFLTAGFPEPDAFWTALDELDAGGADIIEIGVPFSDPVADGPMVEAASHQALLMGISLSWLMNGLRQRQGRYNAPLVLMGYYNPYLQYGLERFAAEAAGAGIAGCIVPDLPLDEDGAMRKALERHGLALIPLVGVNTAQDRLQAYARSAQGFVYLVSVLGATGVRETFPPELQSAFDRTRKAFSLPLALGFGISRPEQVAAMPISPDAVVFGSALLRHLEQGDSAAGFMRAWQAGSSDS